MEKTFDSREYEWADLTLMLGTRDVTGFRGITYTEKVERELIYGKGAYPHSIQSGNISYEGELTLLQSEYEALVKAGKGSVMSLTLDANLSYGNPVKGDPMTTDRIVGLRFTESKKEFKQGDKYMEISLPFIFLRLSGQVR
ncbi:hypothetical protein KTO58_19760 [Chitinophaga pendula]|uniref:hypothetical protein n=1 Tax=Chitinophaga TaxID=79328 RepID=UPI000BB09428|nr:MULTISPECIES: hypothetical protein [Chitinophaga]ASZ11095.1 hypothetical protein CK934_09040 [Chitinophaga sp. MD30]UCJ05907.1 hypothetical protein KTO58_19760 [Chitinophaga pendula]